ncbi:hypothetical protein AX16_006649 [Volvariella volvacea WC 439]|nr:hypothetical protein AX16_006649 [Volvariella volvacea WC 439]
MPPHPKNTTPPARILEDRDTEVAELLQSFKDLAYKARSFVDRYGKDYPANSSFIALLTDVVCELPVKEEDAPAALIVMHRNLQKRRVEKITGIIKHKANSASSA